MEKVNINFTLYSIKDEEIRQTIQTIITVIEEDLHYKLDKITYGKHRNAERHHTHIHTSCSISPESKKYKILNEKIKRTETWNKRQSLEKEKSIIKISFKYDTHEEYSEWKSLAYPLKEYESHEQLVQDLCHIEDDLVPSKLDWEQMRDYAHKIYSTQLKLLEREREIKDKRETDKEKLFDYLDTQITKPEEDYIDDVEARSVIHDTLSHMLFWYRKNDKPFNVNSLKNISINYLYKRQILDTRNILNYLKL